MEAVVPTGKLRQSIITSSGVLSRCRLNAEGRISNVLRALLEPSTPGLGRSLHARLRWASLSQFEGSFPAGMAIGSNAISATRHWCGFRMIACWTGKAFENGPSLLMFGTTAGSTLLA